MNTNKNKLSKELKYSVALMASAAVFLLSASLFPDCGVFVNTIFAGIAGLVAILGA